MRTAVLLSEDEGFGAILELAAGHGWVDTHGDASTEEWSANEADSCEEDALEYLAVRGVAVLGTEGEEITLLNSPVEELPY